MSKIIFPEADNEYIKAACAELRTEFDAVAEKMTVAEAAEKVRTGEYDAMVAGVDASSRDVILACRDVIGVPEGQKTFSSLFVCDFADGRRYIVSDGATCKNPTAEQLKDIIILAHDAAKKILDDAPRLAVLSFSTFGSGGKDPSMDKIREAIALVRELRPDILVDGEMQLDAAVNPRIAAKKAPADSPVAGRANVLITPDINSGNILYKSLEQFAGGKLAGPILLGFKAPVSDLSRGSTTEDIVFTAECLAKLI